MADCESLPVEDGEPLSDGVIVSLAVRLEVFVDAALLDGVAEVVTSGVPTGEGVTGGVPVALRVLVSAALPVPVPLSEEDEDGDDDGEAEADTLLVCEGVRVVEIDFVGLRVGVTVLGGEALTDEDGAALEDPDAEVDGELDTEPVLEGEAEDDADGDVACVARGAEAWEGKR